MRLGIGSYGLAWAIGVPGFPVRAPLDAFGLVGRAVEWKLGVVEIDDNLPLDRLPRGDLLALRALADGAGLALQVGMRGLLEEAVARQLEVAGALGSVLLRTVIDAPGFEPNPAEVVTILRRLVPALQRSGVTLAIENHDRFPSAALAEMVRAAQSPRVGICLDTVNSFGALEGPAVVVENLGPLTVNLHLKEFTVRRADHKMGFAVEGAPAGQGRLDIPWLLSRLRAMGRDPHALLEQWVPPEEDVERTVQKELRWAEQSLAYLRPLFAG
ncbi:MAG TPA: sugar phosphate isomerase/epimerase family protein [Anaeromyxobacter sp.]|nr:sugar phosphate isomerase/epimerase family protein [Anaeromyxobacter sp.]